MDKNKLLRKVAELESINDQLQAEFRYLDKLLRQVGFHDGLATLKAAAHELMEEQQDTF